MATKPRSDRAWTSSDADSQYAEFLEDEARRAGLSVEALIATISQRHKGLFDAAQARAERLGLSSVEELFAHDRRMIEASAYPGEQCLQPFEVELFADGHLAPARAAHAADCAPCATMLECVTPPLGRQEAFAEEVRELAATVVPAVTGSGRQRARRNDVLATGFPFGTVVALLGAYTRDVRTLTVGIVLLLGALSMFLLPTKGGQYSIFQRLSHLWVTSSGAFVTATALALFVGAGWTVVQVQQRSQIANALAGRSAAERLLAEEYMAAVATNSINAWAARGSYPVVKDFAGPVSVSTDVHTARRAVYKASANGGLETLFAEIRDEVGTIYLDRLETGQVRARLATGRITGITPETVTIVDRQDRVHRLLIGRAIAPLRLKDRIIFVTDPAETQIMTATSLGQE